MAAAAFGLFAAGVLFDNAGGAKIDPFVFQPGNYSDHRVAAPVPLEQMPDEFVLGQLAGRFVSEYFGVIPDPDELSRRAANGVLRKMAAPDVFAEWKKNTLPELEKLAEQKAFRIARVVHPITIAPDSDYFEVNYITETYEKPNDIGAGPVVRKGTIYLMLRFKKEIFDNGESDIMNIGKYLEHGGDPAAIFKFRVDKVVQ
jgi:hypothetical protein